MTRLEQLGLPDLLPEHQRHRLFLSARTYEDFRRLLPPSPEQARSLASGSISPLWERALSSKNPDFIREVARLGADPNDLLRYDRRPLHLLVASAMPISLIELLKELGADLNLPDKRGLTPLHAAILAKNIEAARCLINLGADIRRRTADRSTVLHLVQKVLWNIRHPVAPARGMKAMSEEFAASHAWETLYGQLLAQGIIAEAETRGDTTLPLLPTPAPVAAHAATDRINERYLRTCSDCGGRGRCRHCDGIGSTIDYTTLKRHKCRRCWGRGKCTTCDGTGKIR